jgi:hypothetical protein
LTILKKKKKKKKKIGYNERESNQFRGPLGTKKNKISRKRERERE